MLDLDLRTGAPDLPASTADAGLAELLPRLLVAGVAALRRGPDAVAERGVDSALDGLRSAVGWTEWHSALGDGLRACTVSIGQRGLVANRMVLTAEAPTFAHQLVPADPSPGGRLHVAELADWPEHVDDPDWGAGEVWPAVAEWITNTRTADPRAGVWWVPDILEPATPLAPLRETECASLVTRFLNGTEDVPDTVGPPGRGWAGVDVEGRWLAFYEWRPFDRSGEFESMIGFVLQPRGAVTGYYWLNRSSVAKVAVDGRSEWAASDRALVQRLVRNLARSAGLPRDWVTG